VRTTTALLLALSLLSILSGGKEAFANTTDEDRSWHFSIAPYFWLPAMVGDVTVRGESSNVNLSIGDTADLIFENVKFAAIGQSQSRSRE